MKTEDIKALRKKLDITQKELAARIGVDTLTIGRWERGERRPSQLAVRQLNRLVKRVKA